MPFSLSRLKQILREPVACFSITQKKHTRAQNPENAYNYRETHIQRVPLEEQGAYFVRYSILVFILSHSVFLSSVFPGAK
jgi:hypothetical protein